MLRGGTAYCLGGLTGEAAPGRQQPLSEHIVTNLAPS